MITIWCQVWAEVSVIQRLPETLFSGLLVWKSVIRFTKHQITRQCQVRSSRSKFHSFIEQPSVWYGYSQRPQLRGKERKKASKREKAKDTIYTHPSLRQVHSWKCKLNEDCAHSWPPHALKIPPQFQLPTAHSSLVIFERRHEVGEELCRWVTVYTKSYGRTEDS